MYAVEICQKKPEGHKYRSEHVPERGVGSDERVVQVRQRARVFQRIIPLCQIQLIKNRQILIPTTPLSTRFGDPTTLPKTCKLFVKISGVILWYMLLIR